MKKNAFELTLIAIAALGMSFSASAEEAPPSDGMLTVKVTSSKNTRGQIGCSVYDSKDGFPSKPDEAKDQMFVKHDGKTATCIFKNMKPGTYTVSAMIEDDPVESLHEAQGITFSPNTVWWPNLVDITYAGGGDATPPFSIRVPSLRPDASNPIVATFCEPQSLVSALAVNVDSAGARLDADDAEAGGKPGWVRRGFRNHIAGGDP